MTDSSDEDDLEALRQEALKSLKSRNQANSLSTCSSDTTERTERNHHDRNSPQNSKIDPSVSKSFHDHSPPYRRRSPGHEGRSEKFPQERERSRHNPRNHLDHRQDSHDDKERSRGNRRSFKEPFSKANTNSKFESSNRNVRGFHRNYNMPRRQTNSSDRRRNTQLRRSQSPGPRRTNRNPRSVSPSNHRKFPHRSSQNNSQQRSTKASDCQDKNTSDPLSSLPLCSPKHYVELFYGKKLSSNNSNDLSVLNLEINDEDRALLSEKSQSEKVSAPDKMLIDSDNLGESNREVELPSKPPPLRNEILTHQVERIKRTLRRSSPSSRGRERNRDGRDGERSRPSSLRSRTPISERKTKKTKLSHKSLLSKGRLGAKIGKEDIDEEKSSKTDAEIDRPMDPVLEARRKKFECNDIVKVVPKKIKLSNVLPKPDSILPDESDLRNVLIAKHREKSLSSAVYYEEHTFITEDHYNTACAVSLSTMQTDLPPSEETIAQPDIPVSLSHQAPNAFSLVHNSDESTDLKESEQVRVKVEIETDVGEILDPNPPGNSNLSLNLGLPSGSQIADNSAKAPSYPPCDFNSETENIPVFESADYAAMKAIKKEPAFTETEEILKLPKEKPIIDEPELIPQQPDKPESTASAGPILKIKPLTELLDKKVLKKVKKRKKEEKKSAKKKKKRAKSKEKDRESHSFKLSKRVSNVSSQKEVRKASFPTRIVRSALEEALGKKKRKVFEVESEAMPPTNPDFHTSKDHRKVLILDEPSFTEPNEEFSPPSTAAIEADSEQDKEEIEEDSENENLTFRLSSKTPLYSSKKAKKTPDIYKMIHLNQM